ncbi:type II toxin-antitoxin system MqsA family antitoxin [Pseudomonas viridiflava]|uniref:type II toxin-antitoxin system MqsA family antitoxin n=1 Tax=Pseudomonas viridiflava TaxID=33069 RepID=UPI000F014E99
MNCPTCRTADLTSCTRNIPHSYKSESMVISSVSGNHCLICGEVVLDATESARVSAEMAKFNQQVDARVGT